MEMFGRRASRGSWLVWMLLCQSLYDLAGHPKSEVALLCGWQHQCWVWPYYPMNPAKSKRALALRERLSRN